MGRRGRGLAAAQDEGLGAVGEAGGAGAIGEADGAFPNVLGDASAAAAVEDALSGSGGAPAQLRPMQRRSSRSGRKPPGHWGPKRRRR